VRGGGAALTTASCALLALVTATGCGPRVSQKDLQGKVSEFLRSQTGMGADVTCPKDLKGTKGERFTCTTALAGRTTDLDFEFSRDGHFRLLQTRLK
jgi:hypothetical protein